MNSSERAVEYILSCCPTIGAYSNLSGEPVPEYIAQVSREMEASLSTPLFPSRYKEHVAYALDMISKYDFLSPQAAIASVYLATRFEYYFRIISGRLNGDGSWISSAMQSDAKAAISDRRLGGPRISSVSLAYKIMKLERSSPAVEVFDRLDQTLYPADSGTALSDIGDRIEYLRHRSSHGEWGDIYHRRRIFMGW